MKYLFILFIFLFIFLFIGCTVQPLKTSTSTILIKTPKIKYYDKGFINKFANYTEVQILSAGTTILNLKMYKDRVCSSTFKCLNNKEFNKEFLNTNYKDNFLKNLFEINKKEVIHRDTFNGILIKIIRD